MPLVTGAANMVVKGPFIHFRHLLCMHLCLTVLAILLALCVSLELGKKTIWPNRFSVISHFLVLQAVGQRMPGSLLYVVHIPRACVHFGVIKDKKHPGCPLVDPVLHCTRLSMPLEHRLGTICR